MIRLALRALVLGSILSLALVAAAPLPAAPPASDRYTVTPLASNIPGVAPTTDTNLVNGWGLARSADEPVVGRRQRRATRRRSTTVPARSRRSAASPFQTVEGGPTGAVFSGIAGQFLVGTTAAPTTLGTSNFVFANEDGEIRAWRGGSTAALVTVPNTTGAIYKGLAISNGDGARAAALRDRLRTTRASTSSTARGTWSTTPARSSTRT